MSRQARLLLFPSLLALSALATLNIGCQEPVRNAVGTYRIPFEDSTSVRFTNNFFYHTPPGRFDLSRVGSTPGRVSAAAGGWVRYIEDGFDITCPRVTNDNPTPCDNYNGPSASCCVRDDPSCNDQCNNNFVWIEHPYPYCQPAGVEWPGKPANYDNTCTPCVTDLCSQPPCVGFCNEWTKYTHMVNGSITGNGTNQAGLSVGEWVDAGQFLGMESDVGFAGGVHLHFEVARVDPNNPFGNDTDDINNGFVHDWSGGNWYASPNVYPEFCDIDYSLSNSVLLDETYTATSCN